jgi:hypothetical protein
VVFVGNCSGKDLVDVLDCHCAVELLLLSGRLDERMLSLLAVSLCLFPHLSQEVLEGGQHAVDQRLRVSGDLSQGLELLLSLVVVESEFLSVVLETFSALGGIS